MKNNRFKFIFTILILSLFNLSSLADSYSQAETLIKKAQTASIKEESYDYLNNARDLYLKLYKQNPSDIKALLGLSKVNQLAGDRREAKLYVLKAYNTNPNNPKLQKEMGDFFFSFQEYSTAIEYYNLALASGLLKDFETNLKTAKCYEKLGDLKNAELYYQVCAHLNSDSKQVLKKINHYTSAKHPDNSQELENARYKYLFKDKPLSESQQNQQEAEDLIDKINL